MVYSHMENVCVYSDPGQKETQIVSKLSLMTHNISSDMKGNKGFDLNPAFRLQSTLVYVVTDNKSSGAS